MFACAITGLLANHGGKLETNFIYDEARPFEVRLQNVTGDDLVFARDLMAESFSNIDRMGIGHVRVTASSTMWFLALNVGAGYKGWVKIAYPRESVENFLAQTYDVVPFGTESKLIDFDALLQAFNEDKI